MFDRTHTRGRRTCWLAATLIVATTVIAAILAQPAHQSGTSPEKRRTAERDQIFARAEGLEDSGRLEEAIELLLRVETMEADLGLEYDRAGSASYLAELYERLGRFEEASRQVKMSVSILERLASQEGAAEARWRLVDVKWQERDLNLRRTLEPEKSAWRNEAAALASKVVELWNAGRYLEALPLVQRALSLQLSVYGREHPTIALRFHELGLLQCESGDYFEAQDSWTQALDLRRRTLGPAHPLYGESLFNLGEISKRMGRLEEAEALLREAFSVLEVTRPAGHEDAIRSLVSLGTLLREKDDLYTAEEVLLKAKRLAPASGEIHRLVLSGLANLQHDTDNWEAAKVLMDELEKSIRKEVKEDSLEYFTFLQNRAVLATDMADFAQANRLFERAAQILDRIKVGPFERATFHSSWSLLYRAMNDSVSTIQMINQALQELSEALPRNHPQRAMMLQNLALTLDALGETKRAESSLVEARTIVEDRLGAGTRLHTAVLINLGVHHALYGADIPRARKLLLQAADQAPVGSRSWALAWTNLAPIELATGSFDLTMRRRLESALQTLSEITNPTHPDYCVALGNLAVVQFAMSKVSEATSNFHDSLDCLRDGLELAAAVQSERQQLAMMTKAREVLDMYLLLSNRLFLPSEEMYKFLLLWKGSVLTRRLRMERDSPDHELADLRRQLQSVSNRLAALAHAPSSPKRIVAWRRDLTELSRQQEILQRGIAERSATYRRQESLRSISPQQVLDSLPPGAVLIDFVESQNIWQKGSNRLLAFVLSPTQPVQRVDLGPSEALLVLVERWRSLHGVDDGRGMKRGVRPFLEAESETLRLEIGRELFRRLWAPLTGAAGDASLVLWSPDGPVALLPPGALPGEGDEAFLLSRRLFVLVPAAQMLVERVAARHPSPVLKAAHVKPPRLLTVGDVDFDASPEPKASGLATSFTPAEAEEESGGRPKFSDLPASGVEARDVADLFHGSVLSLSGAAATEGSFRRSSRGKEFIHLATHGFFAPPEILTAFQVEPKTDLSQQLSPSRSIWDLGLLSGIAFAGANTRRKSEGDDGILTAVELETLDLRNTKLLVLSACETGLGANVAGEGLLGLLRAAHVSGAQSVVASLWKVPDAETSRLMKRFYKNLWERGMPRAEALRSAQLKILESNPDPSIWAGWMLAGDWW